MLDLKLTLVVESMIKNFLKSNKFIFSFALFIRLFIVKWVNKKTVVLSIKEQKIFNVLKKDGIVTIPNYFSSQDCDTMKKEFDRLVDKHSVYCEENERRVFGINKLSNKINSIFSKDELSWKVCEAYLGESMVLQTTMSARIDYKENIEYGSGGGWHRDSYSRQVKAIAYLTDITDENGPFMYVKGSHRLLNIIKDIFHSHKAGEKCERYTGEEIEEYIERQQQDITYFPCQKGTLVLADIRGLHTTRFLKSGFAYSVFNYYIAKYDDSDSSIRSMEGECVNKTKCNDKILEKINTYAKNN